MVGLQPTDDLEPHGAPPAGAAAGTAVMTSWLANSACTVWNHAPQVATALPMCSAVGNTPVRFRSLPSAGGTSHCGKDLTSVNFSTYFESQSLAFAAELTPIAHESNLTLPMSYLETWDRSSSSRTFHPGI